MRSLVAWLCLSTALAGCRGAPPTPTPEQRAPAPVPLRTAVSIDASTIDRTRLVADEPQVRAQMALVRGLAVRADARFLAAVNGRVPFAITKQPWLDRPCIELSLRELLVQPAPEGSGAPDHVKVRVGLRAELPGLGVSIDRAQSFERDLTVPFARGTAEASLGPAVEEAAALAAGWLVEAAVRPPAPPDHGDPGSGQAAPAL